MIYRNLGNKAHDSLHFIALAGLAFGLPLNKVVMSISMMFGLLNLLIKADFAIYWKRIKTNRFFIVIASFWLIHLLGMFWTNDTQFALNDIRVKLPLIVIPLLLTIDPIQSRFKLNWLMYIFLISLCITSTYNYLSFHQIFGYRNYNDIRGLSLFGSHIRYGILVALGAVFSLYFFFKLEKKGILFLPLFIWFTYYTYFSQIISGTIALTIGLTSMLFLFFFRQKKSLAILFAFLVLAVPAVLLFFGLTRPIKDPVTKSDLKSLPAKTKEGRDYVHYFVDIKDSKGNYLFINLCEYELEREWNKVSKFNYDGKDEKGQEIRFTLIRYMTSMNLKKDAEDFRKLTNTDIRNIENGIAEKEDGRSGIMARLNGIRYQLLTQADPNGHSLLQRIEYWKTGLRIIQKNWLIGVGTGDIQKAFDQQYEQDQTKLLKENRLRAHNTYLTVWISFGVFSLLFFYLIFFYLIEMFKRADYVGFAFIAIAIVTFFIEDTLETQTGVTFFSFFYGLFMTNLDPQKTNNPE